MGSQAASSHGALDTLNVVLDAGHSVQAITTAATPSTGPVFFGMLPEQAASQHDAPRITLPPLQPPHHPSLSNLLAPDYIATAPPILAPAPRPFTSAELVSMTLDQQQQQSNAQDMSRPLNVTDALGYLDSVKSQFSEKPDVYNQFLDIMKDFKSQHIDTPGVIERVSKLFHGNHELIQGFNTFLPIGYRIEVSSDPLDHTITVTTPTGTTTQKTGSNVILSRTTHEPPPQPLAGPGLRSSPMYPSGAPVPPIGPSASLNLAGPGAGPGPISRAMTPHAYGGVVGPGLHPHGIVDPATFSPGFQQQTTAASFLGNLNGKNPNSIGGPAMSAADAAPGPEFNNAIQYLNKIKARYADDQSTYKQFLDILQAYQKEGRNSGDNQVYAQVQMLFKDAPDLIAEFKNFLPDAVPPGMMGEPGMMMPPHMGGGGGGGGHGGGMGAWPHPQQDMRHPPSPPPAKKAAPAKRKKRVIEKEPTPVPLPPPKSISSRSKKVKHHHIPDTDSPAFSPHIAARSPPPPSHMYPANMVQPHNGAPSQHPPGSMQPPNGTDATADTRRKQAMFFDKAKKAFESREIYEEFLKLLSLFSRDIIDLKTLVDRSKVFLGEDELLEEFKGVVGWDERMENPIEHGPPGSIRTQAPDVVPPAPVDDGEGPSYRRLPDSETRLACSGRDELCRSVLNDEWVSHPTWASEEAGFVAHKKNSFEEALHKSEEERHEYHVVLEALGRTIALLDPLYERLSEMNLDEKAAFKLPPDWGGPSKTLYHKTIKKIYGPNSSQEILQAMQESPAVAVPVVLNRLKNKDEEYKRNLREWSRTWREVDSKNYYKSLDHQGISFKQNDKKNITSRHFVADIEAIKAQQVKEWEQEQERSGAKPRKPLGKGSVGHQLEYAFSDTDVLQDSLKMVFAFLERSQVQYSSQERKTVDKFLKEFIPRLFNLPESEFAAVWGSSDGGHAPAPGAAATARGEDDHGEDGSRSGRRSNGSTYSNGAQSSGVPANDLRKKLLKTAQEKASRKDNAGAGPSAAATTGGSNTRGSNSRIGSRAGTPSPAEGSSSRFAPLDEEGKVINDVWTKTFGAASGSEVPEEEMARPFFANTTFYTLLRLLQLLYSRLLMCKEIGADLAEKKHAPLLANQVAVELGLVDPNGPTVVLEQYMEALGQRPSGDGATPNVVYMYLLSACEKMFDNEMDQATFEEHMRWFFGTKAYHLFTLDKLITAFIKQVQTVMTDHKCQELLTLLHRVQRADQMTNRDVVRYRRIAEKHVGQDEHLYRIQWDRETKCIRVSLTSHDEPTIEGDGSPEGRWREYVNTYVMTYPTEWVPPAKRRVSPTFLRRCAQGNEEGGTASTVSREENLRICPSFRTYKLVYEKGSESMLVRRWGREELVMLGERAQARSEDRRRSRWLSG